MLDIRIKKDKDLPIVETLPFQLSILSLGLFVLLAFGSQVVTANSVLNVVGLRISFFDLFIGVLIFVILMVVN